MRDDGMTEPERLPQGQVLRLIHSADPREFSLFLGAGASKSSGVPLAGEMIAEWRGMMYADRAPDGADFDAWCAEQTWYGLPDEYSVLFETLFPNERARQKYVEPKIEAGFPNWGYLYLANLVKAGYFNVIFTTNFDDLINDALSMYLAYNPVVCAADSEVISINIATERAKIIKLHGDYLFKRLKNTVEELEELDPNMESKFREFSKQCGLVVLGYSGRDRSVMNAIGKTFEDEQAFPIGVWWGLRPDETPSEQVVELATRYPTRFKLFDCPDFDAFMVGVHSRRKLALPKTVVKPYESVEERFARLIDEVEEGRFASDTIVEHVRQLKKELDRPWAKAGADVSDLLEARLAIGKRDYAKALELVTAYCSKNGEDAESLVAWGDALAIQSEEQHDAAAGEEAVRKWRAAIRLEPKHLQARYSLARHFHRMQRFQDAIEPAEELSKLAPNDTGVRRSLVQLYSASGRTRDAAELLREMLVVEPKAADLHAMDSMVCEQRGLIARGLKAIELAVQLDGSNPAYRFALGNGLARMGRLEDAAREYERAIELDPKNLGFRLQAAQFYVGRQVTDRAVAHLNDAIVIEPDSAEARGLLGQLLLGLGRPDEALEHIDAALELSPDDSRLLVNAGIVKLQSADYANAEIVLARAAQLNPQQPQPQHWLALLYWVQNRDADAQQALGRLQQIMPAMAQQTGGWLQMMTQQTFGMPGRRRAVLDEFLAMSTAGDPSAGGAAAASAQPGSVVDNLKSALNRFLNS